MPKTSLCLKAGHKIIRQRQPLRCPANACSRKRGSRLPGVSHKSEAERGVDFVFLSKQVLKKKTNFRISRGKLV